MSKTNEILSLGDFEINPIDKDGHFELTMEGMDDYACHYLTTHEAKLLIAYLQKGLDSK